MSIMTIKLLTTVGISGAIARPGQIVTVDQALGSVLIYRGKAVKYEDPTDAPDSSPVTAKSTPKRKK